MAVVFFRSFNGSSEPGTPLHHDSIPSNPLRPPICIVAVLSCFHGSLRVITVEVHANALIQTLPSSASDTIDLEEAQIRQLALDAIEAWNRHDVRAFTRVYSDDAELTTVIGTTVRGGKPIHEHHSAIFETIFKKSHLTPSEIRVRFLSSEIAVVDTHWEMTGALEWDGKEIPKRKGLLNWIVKREREGWLVKVMHNQELTPLRY